LTGPQRGYCDKKLNKFDDIAKVPLDEWIYFFKHTRLPENYKARGLKEVEEKLIILLFHH